MSISVLGGGAWGTALATMLADHLQEPVVLWARSASTVRAINETHRNPAYLGDIALDPKVAATNELRRACKSDIILCVTPAQSFAQLAKTIQPLIDDDAFVVSCAKGIDRESGELLHQLAARHFDAARVVALSGPSFAADVARGLPTAVSLAAYTLATAQDLASRLASPRFRIYASDDVIGVEAGGALKNVLALAVGAARGLGLGASAEAALIARGFAELNRLAVGLGGRPETLAGLSGLGDLVLTCSSEQSRNFAYGMALTRDDDLQNLPLAEGVFTAAIALKLARQKDIDVPIIEMVVQVLEKQVSAREAVGLLLARPLKTEN